MLGVHLPQQAMERLRRRLVEIARGLVGQQQRRPHHQRARHRHPLLLAPGEHARPVLEALAQADPRQQFRRADARFDRRQAADAHRHLDVFERGELRQQVMELEDEADAPVPERDQGHVRHLAERAPAHFHRAPIGAIEAAEHVQQRALADAGCADDGHHLPSFDVQAEIAQHVQPCRARGVVLVQRGDVDERHHSNRSACTGSSREACRDG